MRASNAGVHRCAAADRSQSRRRRGEGPGFSVSLADLRAAHEGFFPKLMGSELTPEF